MPTQEQNTPTLTDNELIARFMKLDRHPNNQRAYWIEDQDCYLTFDNLQFHQSWNQLMPVVDKIEFYASFTINSRCAWITLNNKEIVTTEGKSNLEATYKAVVEFVKWYNSESKHP